MYSVKSVSQGRGAEGAIQSPSTSILEGAKPLHFQDQDTLIEQSVTLIEQSSIQIKAAKCILTNNLVKIVTKFNLRQLILIKIPVVACCRPPEHSMLCTLQIVTSFLTPSLKISCHTPVQCMLVCDTHLLFLFNS